MFDDHTLQANVGLEALNTHMECVMCNPHAHKLQKADPADLMPLPCQGKVTIRYDKKAGRTMYL